VAIPFAGAWRQFRLVAVLTGLVLVECAVLAMNRGGYPLTDLAGRYTEDRTDNFDPPAALVGTTQQDDLCDAFRHWGIVRARAVVDFLALRPSHKNG
jgi:hypothetical protein